MSPSATGRNTWKAAALKYATPNLPGEWHVMGRQLILRPFGFIARGVSAMDYKIAAVLEPLFMPLDYKQANWTIATDCFVSSAFLITP